MPDQSPAIAARNMVMGFRGTHLLYVMAELGMADLLAAGPRNSADLAAALDADRDALHRVLRALAQLGVSRPGDQTVRFALTPVGDCLRSDRPDSLRPTARLWGHEMIQRAWGNLLHTVRTGETAFDHVYGMSAFAYLDANPDAASVYNEFMANRPAAAPAVAAAYDFAPFSTIVDVGGGNGSLLAEILGAYPGPNGVIFDLPHSRPDAEETIRTADLSDRVQFDGGDFFERVTAGGDCYLLRSIIHDWDDARSEAILTHLPPGDHAPRPPPPHRDCSSPPHGDPGMEPVMIDITMLARVGGRERTESEYRALLDRSRASASIGSSPPSATPSSSASPSSRIDSRGDRASYVSSGNPASSQYGLPGRPGAQLIVERDPPLAYCCHHRVGAVVDRQPACAGLR